MLRRLRKLATLPVHLARRRLLHRRWRRRFAEEWARGRESARPGPHALVIVLDGLNPKGNAGGIVRSADGFGAREVHLVGMSYFNPAPAVGCLQNVPLRFFDSMAACQAELRAQGYRVYALEPRKDVAEERFLDDTALAEKTAFVIGSESEGMHFRPEDFPEVEFLSIRQFGTVDCLNAAVSASVAMYEYTRQHGRR